LIKRNDYSFNPKLKIWTTMSHICDFQYSDGESVENSLLTALQQCHDVNCTSDELRQCIVDWPSEYHFSSVRHNLLRPFVFDSRYSILELGCGCGAMTRYMGETGAKVVAVEGSQRRATIAAERCRDLPNVSIYCDNIAEFETQERFNVVTLIGVLEYSALFIPGNDPVGECLRIAQSFLTENGVLILAIENQLGLKYFNACREDHLGISFFGIQDLYNKDTAVTFGKRELTTRLKAAGFDNMSFYYPFPDYKLPNLILADEGVSHPDFHAADLLSRTVSRDYSGDTRRVFHENMAWQSIARNGLLPELSNSFLVTAGLSATSNKQPGWLAHLYTAERLPGFATETVFQQKDSSITVVKRPLFKQTSPCTLINGLHLHHHLPPQAPYICGRLYTAELRPILARGGNITDLANWAKQWIDLLANEIIHGADSSKMIPGIWIDAIPSNFIRDNSGNLILIDEEWKIEEAIPYAWIIIRGIFYTLTNGPSNPTFSGLSFKEAINQILIFLGHAPFTDTDFKTSSVLEDNLQISVNGQTHGVSFEKLIEMLINSCGSPLTISEENADLHKKFALLNRDITLLHREIVRIKSTFSWKITKPFRLITFIFRWLKNFIFLKKTSSGV
jgi:SAM-dependent methyltransferase